MTSPSSVDKATAFQSWVHPPLRNCLFLTGPTSSGKTSLAIEVANRLDAEIISLDSMAIYRGMDIGTAKPNKTEQERANHHLIDILEPTESYSVSAYVAEAHATAKRIRESGKKVLVCGGTPLYLKSLIRGLFLGPEADWEFREAVEEDIKRFGEKSLHDRLAQVDPLLADKIHLHDHRRIIRALEVAKFTGQPLSHWQQQFDTPASRTDFPVAVLQLERSWLHERVNSRVETMLAQGLASEVAALVDKHGKLGRTAAQAVGYREMLDFLAGSTTEQETAELIKAHTRQFARRQEIWFRGLKELVGVPVTPACSNGTIADRVCEVLTSSANQE